MNKQNLFLLATMLATGTGLNANAQISQGGIPLSLQQKTTISNAPVSTYANPDWDAFVASERRLKPEQQFSRPYIVALNATADFGFPRSGQFEVAGNGYRIWRGVISIDNAPAIGLAFDQFVLPKGVQLFVTNENKRQIAGAFDESNNDASGFFAVDAIQGAKVFVELNIAPGVSIDNIKLHINNAVVYHRAIEHLRSYIAGASALDQLDDQLNGVSSVCMINAICANGSYVANPRKATIQTLLNTPEGQGLCSGTLVNNAGNTAGGTCKPYIVTASHCEGSGATNSTSQNFAQLIVRFNFERPDCAGTQATNAVSMTGVHLKARSEMQEAWLNPDNPNGIYNMKGDFILYELKDAIPAAYGAVLSGVKGSDAEVQTTAGSGKKIYGFHHPGGDNKKLSSAASVGSVTWPNEMPDPSGSRWKFNPTEGYAAPGSSGSGLFDGEGYLIGIASVAGVENVPANCNTAVNGEQTIAMDNILYQKISNAWTYNENGPAGANSLKPFLDSGNTGITKINSVNATTCTAITSGGGTDGGVSINRIEEQLNANLLVFPNPSNDGKVTLQFNLKEATDLYVAIIDVAGRIVYETNIKEARSGTKNLNLANLTNGLYVVKVSTAGGFAVKKLLINR